VFLLQLIHTVIPVDSKKAKHSGTCDTNTTTIVLDIDGQGSVNLSMTYSSMKSTSASSDDVYVLDGVSVWYNPEAKYFQNYNTGIAVYTSL